MPRVPTLYGSRGRRETMSAREMRPLIGGAVCLDFVNTTARHGDPAADDDLGSGFVSVLDWCAEAGLLDDATRRRLTKIADKDPREAAAVRRRTMALRAALHDVLRMLLSDATAGADAMHVLNEEARRAREQETLHIDGSGLVWRPTGPAALESPLLQIARDAIDLLVTDRASRIRQCDAPDCERYFLDTSRNGSRRFCSPTGCGSQVRVRRFRERQRQLT